MPTKYLVIDTESTGLGPDASLLTAGFVFVDEEFNAHRLLHLHLKHEVYVVTPQAMEVNKINLLEHDTTAETKSVCGKRLFDALRWETDGGKTKLIPIGHGVIADLQLIWNQILNKNTCDNFISHKALDTCIISRFLQDSGFMPEDQSNSVSALCEYYKLGPFSFHSALEDAVATLCIYRKQRETMSKLDSR